MWKSRVLAKLRNDEPVLCAKQNITTPWIAEIIGQAGFDCIWICMEHCTGDYNAVDNCIRAAKLKGMDGMVRVSKAGYSDIIRPLELDAAGVMYPHCMDADEAARAVRTTKFMPVGRRPIDGGNIDGDYYIHSTTEYIEHANREKFVIVQIEDKEAMDHVEAICATPGLDIVFVGPGDLSHSLGDPASGVNHPDVQETIRRVAEACAANGKHWGLPVSPATVRKYYDMGARFLASGADVVALTGYFGELRPALLDALK